MAEWKKVIVSGSTADLAGLTLSGAVNAGTDTDKFLVLDSSGNVDFRTGTEVLSDIGAGTGGGDITRVNITAGDGLSGTVDTTTGEHTQTLAVDATVLRTTGDGVVSGSAQISLGGDLSGTANSATVAKVQGVALTSGEATQLANIGSTTISSTQWGYLGVMDQNVRTTDAVTFASVDTGQGANELYAMNQDVQTSDSPTFGGLTIDGSVSFNNEASAQSFSFRADNSVTTIATASVSQNLTVGGDLIVNGDLTYLNTTNTLVEDQFILLGSGSAEGSDVGIIFDGVGGGGTGIGAAFFFDGGVSRLSYGVEVTHTDTAVTPAAYIPLVFDVDGAAHTPATDVGNIKIESGEAYIYV